MKATLNNRPQIVISNVSKHHSYLVALAAQHAELLKGFYTSFFFQPKSLSSNILDWIHKTSPRFQRLLPHLHDRYHADLDTAKIVSVAFPELISFAMRKLPMVRNVRSDYQWMVSKNNWFDKRVSSHMPACDIVHSFEGCALHTFRRAKKLDMKTVLDQPIMHPETVFQILQEEYQSLALNVPEAYCDLGMLARKQEEYALADRIFVPAKGIAEDFIARNIPAEKLQVIPYCANSDKFYDDQTLKQDDIFRVLFAGTLCIRKGVHYLLEAFKSLNLENSELVLIGSVDPEVRPILRQYEGHFTHIAHVPQHKLNEWYNKSSVFVLPSLVEGSAVVIYEAMACGLPVIVTKNCGSIIENGEDGFIVPVRDVDILAERLNWLYLNRDTGRDMGLLGKKRIEKFDSKHYMERLVTSWKLLWD